MSKYKPPSFKQGDCLSYRLSDQDWSAAIVVASNDKHCSDEFGCCLVALLDYKEPIEAPLSVFEQQNILHLTHSHWKNDLVVRWLAPLTNRVMRKELRLLGSVKVANAEELVKMVPKAHGFWGNIFESISRQRALGPS